MTDLWYYAEGEKTRGPLSIDELIPLLVRISDPRRIMIWRHGFDDWKPVEEVREVAQQLFRPPPRTPGPPPIPPSSPPLAPVPRANPYVPPPLNAPTPSLCPPT